MPKTDAKGLAAALKKDGLSRIYYIFGADVIGVEKAAKYVVNAAVGDNADFALTKLNGRELDMSALYDTIQMAPMLSEYNCILINDYNCEKPYEDMRGRSADSVNKALLEVLKDIPEYTVVVFNVTGFEVGVKYDKRAGTNVITDKNKKLADFAAKNGILCELRMKTPQELAKVIASKVSSRGSMISIANAQQLAEMCLCDELAVTNEIDKLCAYAAGREIDSDMLHLLVHEQSDVTIYNLANAVAASNAKAAFEAIEQLNISNDNRGSVLYAITGVFLDLYRAAAARANGVSAQTVASDFGYGNRAFVVEKAMNSASAAGIEKLRACLVILRDTTVKLNSTAADPRTAIEQAVTKMLTVRTNMRRR